MALGWLALRFALPLETPVIVMVWPLGNGVAVPVLALIVSLEIAM